MRVRARHALLIGFLVLAGASRLGRLAAQAPVGSADIAITESEGGIFRVEERVHIAPAPPDVELRALSRPCAELRGLRVERSGVEVPGTVERRGPWLVHPGPGDVAAGGSLDLLIRYEIATAGSSPGLPLFHPTTPVPQEDGEREGTVRVDVRLAGPTGGVELPHMSRESPTHWTGRYVAIPSFVQVSRGSTVGGSTECLVPDQPPGDDGGLVWRFVLLVGIMVAWVPLYLAWARRTSEGDA